MDRDRPCTHRRHRETARMEVGFIDANGILDNTMTTTVCKPRARHNAKRSTRTAILPRGWSGAGKGGTASSRSARMPGTEDCAPPTRSLREGRRPRRPQGKAAPGARAEAAACPNQRVPSRAPTGWEGPRPRGPQECRAQGTVPFPRPGGWRGRRPRSACTSAPRRSRPDPRSRPTHLINPPAHHLHAKPSTSRQTSERH
jgi:hypothetical protein